MNTFWKLLVTLLTLTTCALLALQVRNTWFANPPAPIAPTTMMTGKAAAMQNDFAAVAEKCAPAVVVIKTGRKTADGYTDPYSQLYNYFQYGQRPRERTIPTGLGSGFFVSSDGYILTNYHIVKNQDYFRVILHDRKEFDADLVGSDPLSDLAVLKINTPTPLPFLEFADSDAVKVGHWAIAIGAPFSLAHTVTVGIVSHQRRTMGLNVYENFIQTDASINQGNSGGPLLNLEGKVIGINDFILTPSAGNIGLSFAIASNLAGKICNKLIKDGKITRSWLGVGMAEVPDALKRKLKINDGVLIVETWRGGPADRAGIQAGDVVTAADHRKIREPADLQLAIVALSSGDPVRLDINRDGKLSTVKVIAEAIPAVSRRR